MGAFYDLARLIQATVIDVFESDVTFTPSSGPAVTFPGAYQAPQRAEVIYGAVGIEQPDHNLTVKTEDVPAGLIRGKYVTVEGQSFQVTDINPRIWGVTELTIRPNPP